MNTALHHAVAQLEEQVISVVYTEALSDPQLEQRVQQIAEHALTAKLSPGGLMDRLGLFDRRRTDRGAVLVDGNAGHPRMKHLAKLTILMLARTEIWQTSQDIEVLRDSATSARARCDAQSYRMIRWTSALLGAGLERYCDSFCALWSSVLTTLNLRSGRAEDPSVKGACRSLLRMLWLEPHYRSLARSVPLEVLTNWVADSNDRAQAAIVAQVLQAIIADEDAGIELACTAALIEGPQAVLRWAEAQLSAEGLPDSTEQRMGQCVIDLFLQRPSQNGKPLFPKAFHHSNEWVTRLMRVCREDQLAGLRGLIGTRAPQWWATCIPEGSLQDPGALCPALAEIFPQLAGALGERFEQSVCDWMHGQITPVQDTALEAQLELVGWLGVRQEHADSLAGAALQVSSHLFSSEHAQGERPLSLIAKWERWAPLARLLPESLVVEGIAEHGGLRAHLRGIVESGHPRFAQRLLQASGDLGDFLHQNTEEMMGQLHTGGMRASWRWWAFLMAHGPRQLKLDRRQGSHSAQLSFALSQVVRMILVQGGALRETDVVMAGLMLRGANPHRSGGSAWGSAAEQLYVLGISKGELQKRGLQRLLQHLDGLIGRRKGQAASSSDGRR